MKFIHLATLSLLFVLTACWDKEDSNKKETEQKSGHDAFVEKKIKPSPAYNVMDYATPDPSNKEPPAK